MLLALTESKLEMEMEKWKRLVRKSRLQCEIDRRGLSVVGGRNEEPA